LRARRSMFLRLTSWLHGPLDVRNPAIVLYRRRDGLRIERLATKVHEARVVTDVAVRQKHAGGHAAAVEVPSCDTMSGVASNRYETPSARLTRPMLSHALGLALPFADVLHGDCSQPSCGMPASCAMPRTTSSQPDGAGAEGRRDPNPTRAEEDRPEQARRSSSIVPIRRATCGSCVSRLRLQ
jgi:hypothetical protein